MAVVNFDLDVELLFIIFLFYDDDSNGPNFNERNIGGVTARNTATRE